MNSSRLARLAAVPALLAGLIMVVLLLPACQLQPTQIFIAVDGRREALTTEATTVREALAEARITLDTLDQVTPDLYVQLEPGMEIIVTRIMEEQEITREVIPFERQTVVNEALNPGDTRVAQLGVNGEDEVTTRIIFENGVAVSRQEISRVTVIEPAPEILVIGPQGTLPSTPLNGTIAYLSNGNAWLLRNSSASRRTLTTEGDLDGRVFSLSPDGRQLLYTTKLTNEIGLPLNELWLASTTIVGEEPITLGLRGVLHAEWSPVLTQPRIAFSTAERTASAPGWQANNDLWLFSPPTEPGEAKTEPQQIIPANTQGLYPWWGYSFSWSPDGQRLAYARADQVGLIDLTISRTLTLNNSFTPLLDFVPLQTFSEWVWVPGLSWSPDGNFIAATVHGPPLAAEPAEESQVFELWLLSIDGRIKVKVADQVGMWAGPAWGADGIAFGEAIDPLRSVNSRYTIQLIDRDGSNKRQLFPFQEELGIQLPELIWAPTGNQLLFVYNGNMYLTSSAGSPPRQITIDSQVSHPQWAINGAAISTTRPLTTAETLPVTPTITSTRTSTPETSAPEVSPEPTITNSTNPQ